MRRPRQSGQRRRLHHPAAHGGRRQVQGGSGSAQGTRRRRRPRGGQQRPGGVRHAVRGAEERHPRRAVRIVSKPGEVTWLGHSLCGQTRVAFWAS
nr:hypothetical protein [Mycolicibacterium chubuense]